MTHIRNGSVMNQKPYFAEIALNITTHISMTAMNRKHLFPEIVRTSQHT